MICIVTYDITNPRRLRRMHKFLKDFGLNTQRSVFECNIKEGEIQEIIGFAQTELEFSSDSLRIYKICDHCMERVTVCGCGIKVCNTKHAVV